MGRRGAGTFVVGTVTAAPAPAPRGRPRDRPEPAPVDLRAGSPCLEVLDRAAWRRAWRAAGDIAPDGGPEPAADPAFARAVTEHLLRHRGLPAAPEDVLATAGTSAAVGEVARLLPPGSRVGVEDPGYHRVVGALRAAGVAVVPLPVDGDGLVVDAVPGGLAAVYCTPAHQFPLGRRLSAARRTTLVARARAESWWVLEDDYDGELRYDVAPLPLLGALGPDVVVHLGTSSKILSPTLGVGWLVAPAELRAELVARRTATGARPPRAGQRVFTALADSGDLARHLRRLSRELGRRRAAVLAAVAEAGAVAEGDPAGAHVVVPLPGPGAEDRALALAAERGWPWTGWRATTTGTGPAGGPAWSWATPPRRPPSSTTPWTCSPRSWGNVATVTTSGRAEWGPAGSPRRRDAAAQLTRETAPGRGVVRRTTVSSHVPGVVAREQRVEVGRLLHPRHVELLGHHRVVGGLLDRPEDAHRRVAQVLAREPGQGERVGRVLPVRVVHHDLRRVDLVGLGDPQPPTSSRTTHEAPSGPKTSGSPWTRGSTTGCRSPGPSAARRRRR
ncbi:PLP-dependent aminotransferase family protein [Blastococcus brunescens]|uniref:PLP-dependent aminotransferase family protein n=1 Tax=Blastococcus brunescens TaxID=1564165 RepID=A0ABZ1AX45_9ACTN|nr:PLP-dependent aminotransferase family protein [Blastococcus sp. BMG 8361]WRL63127.1 PLP-dependent aminotransferase family protein [Blastococcus sp. BMG 8361]